MSISDKIVGVVLLLISAIIFVYYSVWVLVLVRLYLFATTVVQSNNHHT